jgi:hypothetical protein
MWAPDSLYITPVSVMIARSAAHKIRIAGFGLQKIEVQPGEKVMKARSCGVYRYRSMSLSIHSKSRAIQQSIGFDMQNFIVRSLN